MNDLKGSGKMRIKNNLKRYFKVIGLTGVFCSWTTMAFIWLGLATASYVGYSLTVGLFGLTLVLGKN